MDPETARLTARLKNWGPVAAETLSAAGTELDFAWPRDYEAFVRETGGGEGWVGASYVALWSPDEIVGLNHGYGFPEFAPGLVAFGSDGGGEAFAFDRSTAAIVMVPFAGMDPAILLARSFKEFLRRLEMGDLFDVSE